MCRARAVDTPNAPSANPPAAVTAPRLPAMMRRFLERRRDVCATACDGSRQLATLVRRPRDGWRRPCDSAATAPPVRHLRRAAVAGSVSSTDRVTPSSHGPSLEPLPSHWSVPTSRRTGGSSFRWVRLDSIVMGAGSRYATFLSFARPRRLDRHLLRHLRHRRRLRPLTPRP